ncbi:MAG: hypothetical protein HZC28_01690 [Spirochaetes bacterium]|nr:hypothetical protein [Spirochaetota bacterium]
MKNIVLFLAGTLALYGAWDFPGASVKSVTTNEDRITAVLSAGGKTIHVTATAEPTAADMERVRSRWDVFSRWQRINVKQAEFTLSASALEMIVIPETIDAGATNAAVFLPAGMLFYDFDGTLRYMIRLLKDGTLVKIAGSFTAEVELIARLERAIENPVLFARMNDVDYLSARVEELTGRIESLTVSVDLLRQAFIGVENRGFLGIGNKPVTPAALKAALAAKRANPAIAAGDLAAQLRKGGIELSDQEASLILAVFFNEFPK